MNIRAITLFSDPAADLARVGEFFNAAREAFHVPVQTTRVAMPPFPTWWNPEHHTVFQVTEVIDKWQSAGAEFICLGPVMLMHDAGWLDYAPEIIASGHVLFASAEIADTNGQIDVGRCLAVAETIRRLSALHGNGLGNLFFAALANCPPGTPFFPAAYHGGGPANFGIAVESADLALSAVHAANSLSEARRNIVDAIEREARAISAAALELARNHAIRFSGIDFSLAPSAEQGKGIADALESLGLPWLGAPGSLFAATFFAEAITRADFPRCGFSGLMFPILEDLLLAERAAQGRVTISDLLSYAAVCGAGLDLLPLPGDLGQDILGGILLDVAALAARLRKPLAVRLMPIPGRSAGDTVQLEFDQLASACVLPMVDSGVHGMLAQSARIVIEPYLKNGSESTNFG